MKIFTNFPILLFQISIFAISYGHFMDCDHSCHYSKSDMLNVHLVPYSSDTVGHLKTFSQYYHGSQRKLHTGNVYSKLYLVIQELLKNPSRRFSYGQMAYFYKWFINQEMKVQNDVKHLIKTGQFEILGGGFVLNDEATIHYQSLIDQFTLSLKFLADEFSNCVRPQVAWQIDAYGHSREVASLLSQMGYQVQFINRITKSDKTQLLSQQNAEMIWHTSDVLNNTSKMFTILLKNSEFPDGFCFDTNCNDEPIIDDDDPDHNVHQKVNDFLAYVKDLSKNYRTNEVLVPMGKSFSYENAHVIYNNLDKLVKYVNDAQVNGSNVNVFYSTPSCYLKALNEVVPKPEWPVKTNDFFPYNSWTGYYTSRPSLKRLERYSNHYMQVVKQLVAISQLQTDDINKKLNKLRRHIALIQNYNGISGMATQYVVNDYVKRLSSTLNIGDNIAKAALQKLTKSESAEFLSCHQLNISVCEFSEKNANNLEVILYNPLSRKVVQPVRLPYPYGSYYVKDSENRLVKSQLRPITNELVNLSHLRHNSTQHEIVFLAEVDKLRQYYIIPKPTFFYIEGKEMLAPFVIKNSLVKLHFNKNGFLNAVEMNGVMENIYQSFYYYKSAKEDKEPPYTKGSGIYAFVPENYEAIEISQKVRVELYDGPVVKEIHQYFNEWISQIIRIYEHINRVEFEWVIGPIPVAEGEGKEIITRFTTTNITTNGIFYTDGNGREMIQRKRYEQVEPYVTRNYYPVTSRIVIQDDTKRLALLNDRPQGGSSIKDGTLELMLHRRILMDDGAGLDEYLNEMEYNHGLVVRGKTYLILNKKDSVNDEINLQQEIHLPLWPFLSQFNETRNFKNTLNFTFLPDGVNILTLEPYNQNELLLRLENIYQNLEGGVKRFDLKPLLNSLKAVHVREMSLDGNLAKANMNDSLYQKYNNLSKHQYLDLNVSLTNESVFIDMNPMEIRTLIVTWK